MKTNKDILDRNKKYRKSPDKGKSPLNVLKERYRSLVKRCYLERHSSTPENLCSKEDFLNFGMNNAEYHRLYNLWKNQGFKRGESPSVDRIEVTKGYSLDNIQFLTLRDNVKKSHKECLRQKHSVILIKDGIEHIFESGASAAKYLGVTKSSLLFARKNGSRIQGCIVKGLDTPSVLKQRRNKEVIVLDIETNTKVVFENVKIAANFLEIAESSLRASIRKRYTIKKKYIANYKGDKNE